MSGLHSATPSKAKFNDSILPDIQGKDYHNELENYEQHVYQRSKDTYMKLKNMPK